jgi:drug/metabolite transporter (DMT)-like permease
MMPFRISDAQNSRAPSIPAGLALLGGVVAISTASIFIRFAQREAPSLVIAAFRLTLATLILLPWLMVRERVALRGMSRDQVGWNVLSGILLAVHFASWITSLEYTSVASSVVLVSTAPLFVAILSPITVREPLTKGIFLGLVFALGGTALIGLGDACTTERALVCPPLSQFVAGPAVKGDILALIGAIAGAGYILIGRHLRGKVDLIPYIAIAYGSAAVCLVLAAWSAGHRAVGYSPATYLWFVLLAVVPQLLGHSTLNWALRHLPAAFVSISLLGEPIGSSILALLILGERPGAVKLVGSLLILTGIAIAARGRPEADHRLPAPAPATSSQS